MNRKENKTRMWKSDRPISERRAKSRASKHEVRETWNRWTRREGERSPGMRTVAGSKEGEGSPIQRKANGRRFKGRRTVAGKAKGRRFEGRRTVAGNANSRRFERRPTVAGNAKGRRFEGRRTVAGNANNRRFEGRWTVADSKEGERSSGMRRVADSKEVEGSPGSRKVAGAIWSGYQCVYLQRWDEASPLSLIGDGWLLTELHWRRLSSTTTVGAQRRWCFGFFWRGSLFFFFFWQKWLFKWLFGCLRDWVLKCLWVLKCGFYVFSEEFQFRH